MQASELEYWILQIVKRVERSEAIEDFRIEAKGVWPDDYAKAARQLAGHCNAAHGEPVLWIIGLDEQKGVKGAEQVAFQNWWPQVRAQYDQLAPSLLRDQIVHVGDKTVVALLFDTERAPFVVKNPQYGQAAAGPIAREVPWREATSVRSARREDLLCLLVPLVRLPQAEVLDARLLWRYGGLEWELRLEVYFYLASHKPVSIPFHLCAAAFSIAPLGTVKFPNLLMKRAHSVRDLHGSPAIIEGGSEVRLEGPGLALRAASLPQSSQRIEPGTVPDHTAIADYVVRLRFAGEARGLVLSGQVEPVSGDHQFNNRKELTA
jgi:hypothetical protein